MCSMSNQEFKVRTAKMNINSKEPLFYPHSILVKKCSGSCNSTNDPYDKLRVPDVIKDMNTNLFNLMLRTNETRYVSWHEACTCQCRLDASVCK